MAVVLNPVKITEPDALKRALAEHCPSEIRWWQTTEDDPGAGQARAAVAAGAELVLVCGGDGTVAACAGALAGSGVAMAIVPGGTGNLLARNLGIPLRLDEAVELAFAGTERRIDVLEAGDQRFVVIAGLGFDAALIHGTDEQLKAKLGWLAYLGGFVRAIRRRRQAVLTITVDDQPALRRRAIGVLVGNVGQLQAGLRLLPEARPDDGRLDVITLAPRTAGDWPVLVARILRRRPDSGDQADTLRGRRVSITADRSLPVEFDGDFRGERAELTVEVLPGALLLRCPAP
ncbi:MAG: diacylglycerol/lipid kinase family protein [Jatrophihabitans sp.]